MSPVKTTRLGCSASITDCINDKVELFELSSLDMRTSLNYTILKLPLESKLNDPDALFATSAIPAILNRKE
jgi:hypothetical protein